jgi:hypothetical protein
LRPSPRKVIMELPAVVALLLIKPAHPGDDVA